MHSIEIFHNSIYHNSVGMHSIEIFHNSVGMHSMHSIEVCTVLKFFIIRYAQFFIIRFGTGFLAQVDKVLGSTEGQQ
ncbi:hypothetical protein L9F63_018581, partial [Diploptera punctata]